MSRSTYIGIYDFKIFPYALGDVLTWNVQTACKAREVGRTHVDIYICLDPQSPASIYQSDTIVADNADLFFSELFGAFGTHPRLGNIHFFRNRDEMVQRLDAVSSSDDVNKSVFEDYKNVLGKVGDDDALNEYFIKYIYSHKNLNSYYDGWGELELLNGNFGCEPDVTALFETVFANKKVVVIHPRLRLLDAGYKGEHTYSRDSDFLEWYDFVRQTEIKHPEIQFVVAGRLQEKPLKLLQCKNVTSLRPFGLGLGHELSLIRRADCFIGTSSGFAAMANFCEVPYFITNMNKQSCIAYDIENGADALPFADPNQKLIYETETVEMLSGLLSKALSFPNRRENKSEFTRDLTIDTKTFGKEREKWLIPYATSYRFFIDEVATHQETSFILKQKIDRGFEALEDGDNGTARDIAERVTFVFPETSQSLKEIHSLKNGQKRPFKLRMFVAIGELGNRLDGNVMPNWMRETVLHKIAHWTKRKLMSFKSF